MSRPVSEKELDRANDQHLFAVMMTVRTVAEVRDAIGAYTHDQDARSRGAGPGQMGRRGMGHRLGGADRPPGGAGQSPGGAGHRLDGTVGLVPTMGALHQGHLSLMEVARKRCDFVVVSLFVNPSQFDEQGDLDAYPRQESRDADLARAAGVDLLFAPAAEEIYRPGFATAVEVSGLTDRLEGAVRGAAHFRGVTTVVCKLLNICTPDVAFFGQKDAQQAAVIRRMVSDLDIDVEIATVPTVRDPDGLALSSRNARLGPAQRRRALALHRALEAAEAELAAGERSAARLCEAARVTMAAWSVEPEYVALVDPETFADLDTVATEGLLAVAARVDGTRLIDNVLLEAGPTPAQPIQSGAPAQPDPSCTTAQPDADRATAEKAPGCTTHPDRTRTAEQPDPNLQPHQGELSAICTA